MYLYQQTKKTMKTKANLFGLMAILAVFMITSCGSPVTLTS